MPPSGDVELISAIQGWDMTIRTTNASHVDMARINHLVIFIQAVLGIIFMGIFVPVAQMRQVH